MKRTLYKGYVIDTDSLGRPYIYNTSSRYTETSDHILIFANSIKDIKSIIDNRISSNQDIRNI